MAFRADLFFATAASVLGALAVAAPSSAQIVTTYGYDAQGQLMAATRSGQATTYGYDRAGNRVAVTASGSLALRSAASTAAVQSQIKAAATPQRPSLKQAPAGYTFVPDNSGSRPFWPKPTTDSPGDAQTQQR